jgi:hypothetical protein
VVTIKDISKMGKNMGLEDINILTEMYMKAGLRMISQKEKG